MNVLLAIALVVITLVVVVSGQIIEQRKYYLEFKGQKGYSGVVAFLAAIPGFLFLFAGPFGMLPARTYLWVFFLGLLWLTLLHERLRHRMAGHNPQSFVPLLTGKLAEAGGWIFAGGVLGLLLLFFMYAFTPAEIGRARSVLVGLKAILKVLKLGGGATILLLSAILLAQWRFPARKDMLDRLWTHWSGTQTYLKRALLVMTSIFCFSYTGTFRGGPLTPLMHKIDLVEQNYRDFVWRAQVELSGDLRIEAYRKAYASYPPKLQSAIRTEVATGKRAARLPAKYLPAHFVGYSGHLPSDFESHGDDNLSEYVRLLDQQYSDDSPVPDDVPTAGLLMEGQDRPIDRPRGDAIPDWLTGLPGELAEKIVDRVLDLENATFVEEFSNEFPLLGSLIGTVDGQLNAALAEKVKLAAGRIAHRRVREQTNNLNSELGVLASQVPDMQTRAKLESHVTESRAITKIVAKAEPVAASDLQAAIHKVLGQVAEQRGENPEKRSGHEDEKVRLENEKTVKELTQKYGYDYLLSLHEDPESAFRVGTDGRFLGHELPREYEAPHLRPEPIMPHEFSVR